MTMHDNEIIFINIASIITILGGGIILFILICRRYLYAICEHVDTLIEVDNFIQSYRVAYKPKQEWIFYITKRIIDIAFASILLLIILPIMIVIPIIIKITSPGPIFFRQNRIGKDGKTFHAYKFRTMAAFSQEDKLLKEINFFIAGDPRVTTIGRFLRKTSLDELPKLINVLKGDMSLVGTSEAIDYSYISTLSHEIADVILSVKPGLSSLWSISGSRMRWDLSSRLAYDLYYVSHQSFILDLSIFLMTPLSASGRVGYEADVKNNTLNSKQKTGF